MTEQAPFVFILGMHRSGTSCLAGALELCGLYLGDVLRRGRHNAKGYFESRATIDLHNQILGLNRGSWYSPPEVVSIHPYHLDALSNIAHELDRRRPCGIKDPRLLLFLDSWLQIAGAPHAFVGTFRHPVSVANSLMRRNGIAPQTAYDLWQRYNQKLVELHRHVAFPIIEYRMDNVPGYCAIVVDIAISLGLTPDIPALRKFVESRLDHHLAENQPVPAQCQELYAYLQKHSYRRPTPSVPVDQPRWLHRVKRVFSVPRSQLENGVDWARAVQMGKALSSGQMQRGLFFIGNPRSGTTLVRSLLDAHPMILLGNEINAMKLMENDHSWQNVIRRIIHSSLQFRRRPIWTNYSYRIPDNRAINPAVVRIIGDKKTGATTRIVQTAPTVLDHFLDWVPLPVTFIHCVRHPLDVIATKTRCNRQSVELNIQSYFAYEATASFVADVIGPQRIIRLYHEQFIAQPVKELNAVLNALDLPGDEAYLQACISVVNPVPHETRHAITWTPEMLAEIEYRMVELPHLAYYLERDAWQVRDGA